MNRTARRRGLTKDGDAIFLHLLKVELLFEQMGQSFPRDSSPRFLRTCRGITHRDDPGVLELLEEVVLVDAHRALEEAGEVAHQARAAALSRGRPGGPGR